MADLDFQQLGVAQSAIMPKPVTIASAASIAPTTRFSRISGAVSITTIAPPVSGYHELVLVFDNATANALNTGGNIQVALTPVVNRPYILFYDPRTSLYYIMAVA